MMKGTYATPTVTDCGPAVPNTLGGHRFSVEGAMKQP
jgi:hypothetical protein